ncbi:MAG: hypothetical protein GY861_11830 [bacterium]|nr:hypothetical protein [bacterium]
MIRTIIMWVWQRLFPIPCKRDYGINVHLLQDEQLKKLEKLNPPLVRCDFNWFLIEPIEGGYDWAMTDKIVSFCTIRHIKILAIIGYAPAWVDNDLDVFAIKWCNFVKAVTERYGDMIDYYEIWNEPNLPRFYQKSMPFYFYAILQPAYEIIKKTNSLVVAPCVAVMNHNDWHIWIKFAESYSEFFDIISFHVYRDTALSTIARIIFGVPFRGGSYSPILKTLRKFNKPIWLSETGWKTDHVTYRQQKQYIELLLHYVQHSAIEKVVFYDIMDAGNSFYGIMENDLTEKPAFKFLEEL